MIPKIIYHKAGKAKYKTVVRNKSLVDNDVNAKLWFEKLCLRVYELFAKEPGEMPEEISMAYIAKCLDTKEANWRQHTALTAATYIKHCILKETTTNGNTEARRD